MIQVKTEPKAASRSVQPVYLRQKRRLSLVSGPRVYRRRWLRKTENLVGAVV